VPCSEKHAGEAVTLKDIEAARRAHRRFLRGAINERIARVSDFLLARAQPSPPVPAPKPPPTPTRPKLRIYQEDDP